MLNRFVSIYLLLRRQDGQGVVEYAMIVGMVALGVFFVLNLLGAQVADVLGIITTELGRIEGVDTE